jgi:hypothetical protein
MLGRLNWVSQMRNELGICCRYDQSDTKPIRRNLSLQKAHPITYCNHTKYRDTFRIRRDPRRSRIVSALLLGVPTDTIRRAETTTFASSCASRWGRAAGVAAVLDFDELTGRYFTPIAREMSEWRTSQSLEALGNFD